MTIKTRNRINLTFAIFSTVFVLSEIGFIIYSLLTKRYSEFPVFMNKNYGTSYLFRYNQLYTVIGIIFIGIYTFSSSFIMLHAFSKTQSSEVIFFLLFLLALLCDSSRLFTPIIFQKMPNTKTLIFIGNVTLFSKILVPLSLLGLGVLSTPEERKNIEWNCLLVIVAAGFIAYFVPLNTSILFPNFSISYSFKNIIELTNHLVSFLITLTLALDAWKNHGNQKITIGFALLVAGIQTMFYCTSLFRLIFGTFCLLTGTPIFLKHLHNKYMWND